MASSPRRRQHNPFPKAAVEASAIMMGAPFVIASRMTQIALAGSGPTARDQKENQRMVVEKISAAQQSAVAFNQAIFEAALEMPFWIWGHNPMLKSFDTIASATLKPYSSRVRANRKRLAKRD